MFLISFISAFINLLLNSTTLTLLIIKRKKKLNKHVSIQNNFVSSPETKLCILTFIMFIEQFMIGVLQVSQFLKIDKCITYGQLRFYFSLILLTQTFFLLIIFLKCKDLFTMSYVCRHPGCW
jgi:hypothetical protein